MNFLETILFIFLLLFVVIFFHFSVNKINNDMSDLAIDLNFFYRSSGDLSEKNLEKKIEEIDSIVNENFLFLSLSNFSQQESLKLLKAILILICPLILIFFIVGFLNKYSRIYSRISPEKNRILKNYLLINLTGFYLFCLFKAIRFLTTLGLVFFVSLKQTSADKIIGFFWKNCKTVIFIGIFYSIFVFTFQKTFPYFFKLIYFVFFKQQPLTESLLFYDPFVVSIENLLNENNQVFYDERLQEEETECDFKDEAENYISDLDSESDGDLYEKKLILENGEVFLYKEKKQDI